MVARAAGRAASLSRRRRGGRALRGGGPMPNPWPPRARLGWTLAAAMGYALAGAPLVAALGPEAGSLSVLPVALAAALLGWRGGLALALLCIPINTLHLHLAGYPGWDALFRHGGVTGLIALL